MRRRKFLQLLGLAPVAAVLPAVERRAPTDPLATERRAPERARAMAEWKFTTEGVWSGGGPMTGPGRKGKKARAPSGGERGRAVRRPRPLLP